MTLSVWRKIDFLFGTKVVDKSGDLVFITFRNMYVAEILFL